MIGLGGLSKSGYLKQVGTTLQTIDSPAPTTITWAAGITLNLGAGAFAQITCTASGGVAQQNWRTNVQVRRAIATFLDTASPVSVSSSHQYMGGDTTAGPGPMTFQLQTLAAAGAGRELIFFDEGGGAGADAISIAPSGLELINGVNAPVTIITAFGVLRLVAGPTGWIAG